MTEGLLISCCNVKRPFGRFSLVYLSLVGRVPYFVDLNPIADKGRGLSGITGLAFHAGCYFVALQGGLHSEIAVLDSNFAVKNVLPLPGVRDIHGLRSDGDRLFIVSTGSNQVFLLDSAGQGPPRQFWTPPAKATDRRIHLNDIIEFRGRQLVLSHRRLDQPGRTNGTVFDIHQNEVVTENLLLPHTFLKMDDRLLVCDSQRGRLVELLDSRVVPVFEQPDRFLRGATVVDDHIIVGSSCLRVFSRSRGTAKKYAEEMSLGDEKFMSWLYFLNRRDFSLESTFSFSTLGFEIYDILPVERAPSAANLIAQPDAVRTQAIANRMAELEAVLEGKSGQRRRKRRLRKQIPSTGLAGYSVLGFWSKIGLGRIFRRM